MVGLLAYAAAGAAQGLGKGLVEQAQQMREDAYRALDRADRLQERAEDRGDRARERAEDRSLRASERAEDRQWSKEDRASEYAQRANESAAEWERRKEEMDLRYGYDEKSATRDRGWKVEDREDEQGYRTGEREAGQEYDRTERARERDFRTDERRESENFTRDRDQEEWVRREDSANKERTWRSGESEKDRADRGEILETDDGRTLSRRGSKAETIRDENGNPVGGLMPRYGAGSRGGADGGMSATERRMRINEGFEAGGDGYGAQDWGKSIRRWRTLGLDPSKDAELFAEIQAGIEAEVQQSIDAGDVPPEAMDAEIAKRLDKLGLAPKKEPAADRGQPAQSTGAAPAGDAGYSRSNPARPASKAEFDALPSGTPFINPADGKLYEKQ